MGVRTLLTLALAGSRSRYLIARIRSSFVRSSAPPYNQTQRQQEGMRWVLGRVVERLDREGEPALVRRLLTATFVLMGLRLDRNQVRALFQGVRVMHESATYQAILDEGEVRGLHKILLRQGRMRFGEPGETVRQAVLGIQDLQQLERLAEDLLQVSTWQELLARVRPEGAIEGPAADQ
jgi:hypothetical protein